MVTSNLAVKEFLDSEEKFINVCHLAKPTWVQLKIECRALLKKENDALCKYIDDLVEKYARINTCFDKKYIASAYPKSRMNDPKKKELYNDSKIITCIAEIVIGNNTKASEQFIKNLQLMRQLTKEYRKFTEKGGYAEQLKGLVTGKQYMEFSSILSVAFQRTTKYPLLFNAFKKQYLKKYPDNEISEFEHSRHAMAMLAKAQKIICEQNESNNKITPSKPKSAIANNKIKPENMIKHQFFVGKNNSKKQFDDELLEGWVLLETHNPDELLEGWVLLETHNAIEQKQVKKAKEISEDELPLHEFAHRTVIEGINQDGLARGIHESEQDLKKKEATKEIVINQGKPEDIVRRFDRDTAYHGQFFAAGSASTSQSSSSRSRASLSNGFSYTHGAGYA